MHYAGVAAAFCFGACHRCPHYFFAAHGWILHEAEGLRWEVFTWGVLRLGRRGEDRTRAVVRIVALLSLAHLLGGKLGLAGGEGFIAIIAED